MCGVRSGVRVARVRARPGDLHRGARTAEIPCFSTAAASAPPAPAPPSFCKFFSMRVQLSWCRSALCRKNAVVECKDASDSSAEACRCWLKWYFSFIPGESCRNSYLIEYVVCEDEAQGPFHHIVCCVLLVTWSKHANILFHAAGGSWRGQHT